MFKWLIYQYINDYLYIDIILVKKILVYRSLIINYGMLFTYKY